MIYEELTYVFIQYNLLVSVYRHLDNEHLQLNELMLYNLLQRSTWRLGTIT